MVNLDISKKKCDEGNEDFSVIIVANFGHHSEFIGAIWKIIIFLLTSKLLTSKCSSKVLSHIRHIANKS